MVESGTDLSGLDVLAGIVGCAGMEERARPTVRSPVSFLSTARALRCLGIG